MSESPSTHAGPVAPAMPAARIQPARTSRWVWIIPAAAAVFAAALLFNYAVKVGPVITIHLPDGHGLKPNDTLRCLGIVVGQVQTLRLAPDGRGVVARVRLERAERQLAVAGSQFWVVRPTADWYGLSGLETIAGPRYLAVIPGDGEPQATFIALTEPPVPETISHDGLEVMLTTAHRGSLRPGTPITHRGVRIGTVLSVALASDAASVDARAYIRPAYTALVRDNSRFWQDAGIAMKLGVTGLNFDMPSLANVLVGAVALATPDRPGNIVATGHRFEVAQRPEDAWLAWRPPLAVGSDLLATHLQLPPVVRVTVRRSAGQVRDLLGREHAQTAWALPVPGGLILPADVAPHDAHNLRIELAGQQAAIPSDQLIDAGMLTVLRHDLPMARHWQVQLGRTLDEPEDLVIITDSPEAAVPIAATRVTAGNGRWHIDPAVALPPDLHGAAVLARSDARVVGLLTVHRGQAAVIPIDPNLTTTPPAQATEPQ